MFPFDSRLALAQLAETNSHIEALTKEVGRLAELVAHGECSMPVPVALSLPSHLRKQLFPFAISPAEAASTICWRTLGVSGPAAFRRRIQREADK